MSQGDDDNPIWSCPDCPVTFTSYDARHAHECPTPMTKPEEINQLAIEATLFLQHLVSEQNQVINKIILSIAKGDIKGIDAELLMNILEVYHQTPLAVMNGRIEEKEHYEKVYNDYVKLMNAPIPTKQTCAFCNLIPEPSTGPEGEVAIREHIQVCEKHPLFALRAFVKNVEEEVGPGNPNSPKAILNNIRSLLKGIGCKLEMDIHEGE